jgi:hypothetical protein
VTRRFHDAMTLGEAKMLLRELAYEGHACPCCTQLVKVYKRKVNSSMAADLIAMWRAFHREWGYLPDLRRHASLKGNREESKLRYWGLVEEEPERRPDGGRAGWWRVTPKGADWIQQRTWIPKYALIYDGKFLRYDGSERVTIRDALGDGFDYNELMRGE